MLSSKDSPVIYKMRTSRARSLGSPVAAMVLVHASRTHISESAPDEASSKSENLGTRARSSTRAIDSAPAPSLRSADTQEVRMSDINWDIRREGRPWRGAEARLGDPNVWRAAIARL